MLAPYSGKVGPRRGGAVLPSLLPLFKGNYLFSSSMLRQLVGAAFGEKPIGRYCLRRIWVVLISRATPITPAVARLK